MNFKEKVVIVTGASSGIGAAIALKFSLHGAKITIVGRNADKLKNVSENIGAANVLVVKADVAKDADVKRIVDETIKTFGKLDILVNNAGTAGFHSILSENAMVTFDQIMATNLRSAVYLTHLAAPFLIKTKGNIINISSISSKTVFRSNNFPYCTSKAGLDHFSRAVAYELSEYGVRVNVVNPGPVKTDFMENMGMIQEEQTKMTKAMTDATALGKISESDEVADMVLFLASDLARSITGATHVIDNGILLKCTSH